MPLSQYDKYYGGTKGSAAEGLASMKDEYGEKEGTRTFYATKNKNKNKFSDRVSARARLA
jgi:hypothetical protein